MTNRITARCAAAALLALTLAACASNRPDPEPIVDPAVKADAVTLPGEFHRARIGHDGLRSALPQH